MKIGILTQPLLTNYGGLLQNFALQQVLKSGGHKVETLDWHIKRPRYRHYLSWFKWFVFKILNKKVSKPRYQLNEREATSISKNTQKFIDNYLTICPKIAQKQSDFSIIARDYNYNAFVVGSDQVWRPSYNWALTSMFLDFCEKMDVKRIAYAASFGTSKWEFSSKMTDICSQLVQEFDFVSVREDSGVSLCKDYLGVDAVRVLDPTLLINREDYENLVIEEREPRSEGTLFYYILDPSKEKKNFVESVANQQGLKPFTILPKCQAENRTKWDVRHRIDDCVFPSVTSWLRAFMDAQMVIVDSFHGAVFSIIFNKPFWVIGNKKRGNARFESLLKLFELEDRLIPIHSISETDWQMPIDWMKVNEIREKEKVRSINYLRESIEK